MTPEGIDMHAIGQALHKHINSSGGSDSTPPQKQAPEGGKPMVKSGKGFDSHTNVLAKALIHKLLTVV